MAPTLSNSVLEFIRREKLLPDGEAVLVAVSGGLDSIVLLEILRRHAAEHGWRLTVAHYNHRLRGRESDDDESFVRRLAERANLPFVAGRATETQPAPGQSQEMTAREDRHRFLARIAAERAVGQAALAHHADDQVELFFLRVLRGAGSAGLGGMPPCNPSPCDGRLRLVRPLLEQNRASLRAYAGVQELQFREDASNRDCELSLRNRLRHQWLPLLAAGQYPALRENVLRTMNVLRAEHRYLAERSRAENIASESFENLPVAVQRESLRQQLLARGITPDLALVETLRRKRDRPATASGGRAVSRNEQGRLTEPERPDLAFSPNERWIDIAVIRDEPISFAGLSLRIIRNPDDEHCARSGRNTEYFDADSLGTKIRLRHWRPGDRFGPIGMTGTVKLQDWFVDQKIPIEKRRRLVVAEHADGRLFWIENQRIARDFRITGRTRRTLCWNWSRSESL